MTGPVLARDLAIVLRALIDILDHHRDRMAGGDEDGLVVLGCDHAGQDANLVRFAPLGDEARDWPGLRRSSSAWIWAGVKRIPGGHPSTTQPSAGPWLSPQVVTRKRWPNVLCDMALPDGGGLISALREGSNRWRSVPG